MSLFFFSLALVSISCHSVPSWSQQFLFLIFCLQTLKVKSDRHSWSVVQITQLETVPVHTVLSQSSIYRSSSTLNHKQKKKHCPIVFHFLPAPRSQRIGTAHYLLCSSFPLSLCHQVESRGFLLSWFCILFFKSRRHCVSKLYFRLGGKKKKKKI